MFFEAKQLTMSSIHAKIQAAAPQNTKILQILTETDYATSALQQNNTYIMNLEQQIYAEEQNLKKASKTVESEYADHKKYRDSHMRRLAYKLGRKKEKFAEEASKEEREWIDAVRIELLTKHNLEQLKSKLMAAKEMSAEMKDVAKVNEQTKGELDDLYKSIFSGPTPDFPGEDEKERLTAEAERHFHDTQLRMSTENHGFSILKDADRFLAQALNNLASASDAATADVWGLGGSFADMAKHSKLSKAQEAISQTQVLISQAHKIQPQIQGIGKLDVPELRFMTDVVFDNIFSDLNARDRIRESKDLLTSAKSRLAGELNAEGKRVEEMKAELAYAGSVLNGRREELQMFRRRAFEEIASANERGEDLPTYSS